MKFALMLFASSEDALAGDKYHLVMESARFGDRHGFSSVWVPERHFTKFGALYPNPAVLHAALAMTTARIRLHAGSVVTPLHNPIRIAEEWAVVDNLSRGRIGISFASGWNPDDFAFFPERYADRHEEMYQGIATVRRLWRGETLAVTSGNGKAAEIRIYPTPVQKELPVCLTAAGNPRTYQAAGQMGANLLTHILDQDIDQLAEKIALYRKARSDAGFDPDSGQVTLMLHTFVGTDAELVREQARRPYCEYLKANLGLLGGVAQSRGRQADVAQMSASDMDEFVNYLYDRFASTRGLIGTPESCLELVREFESVGVDEIACLLDFGPDKQLILDYLPHLNRLKTLYAAQSPRRAMAARNGSPVALDEIKLRCAELLSGAQFHALIATHGIQISSAIQFVEQVWRRDGEVLAQLRLPDEYAASRGYHVHPAALDACGRVLAAALPQALLNGANAELYLPAGMRSFRMHRPPTGMLWSHAILKSSVNGPASELFGDVRVYDSQGKLLWEVEDLKLKRARPDVAEPTAHTPSYDRWLYRRAWKPAALDAMPHTGRAGEGWLIIADRQGIGRRLAEQLTDRGEHSVLVEQAANAGAIERLVVDALQSDPPIGNIIYLWGLDTTPSINLTTERLLADRERAIKSALNLVQALAAAVKTERLRTYFVTQGAMPIAAEKERLAFAQAPLWGLARAVAVEHPNLWGGLIDLDPADSPDAAAEQLAQVLTRDHNEDMIGLRAGAYHVARLEPHRLPARDTAPPQFSAEASYLITGGLGGLGRRLALWMAERGARHLCLLGRGASKERAADFLRELENRGVKALVIQADVAREADVARALGEVSESLPPLRGIFHLAGSLDDALLVNESWERLTQIGAAKLEGAWHLHQLTAELKLDYFVMFSSAASLLTASGQANYAAANTFMDGLAHYRRGLGLHALAVNWGPWAEAGHAETVYGREAHAKLRFLGIQSIPPDQGLDLLGLLLASDCTQTAAIDINWEQLFRNDPAAARLALFSEMAETVVSRSPVQAEGDAGMLRSLRELPESERRRFLMDYLSQQIARTLKLDAGFALEPRQQLFDLGFDSIMAIELKNRLERSFGRSFSATLLFMHPTLESLTGYLLDDAIGSPGNGAAQAAIARPEEVPNVDTVSEEQMVSLLLREIEAGRA